MVMMPKRYTYRKIAKRGKLKGVGSWSLRYGTVGLIALEEGYVSARQIEAARRGIRRTVKRVGKLWVRVFPNHPVTKKPIEVRMGGGSGSIKCWVAVVKPGTMLFEVGGVDTSLGVVALNRGGVKMPIRTKVVVSDSIPASSTGHGSEVVSSMAGGVPVA